MRIVQVHLLEGEHTPHVVEEVLIKLSRRYAEVLDASLERVRAVATLHPVVTRATAARSRMSRRRISSP